MAKAIHAGAAAEAALAKAAAAYHRKRVEFAWVKKTSAESAAEKYDLEIPQGIALQMPAWLRSKAKAAIGESFEGEWWDGIGETTKAGLMNFVKLGLQDGWSIRRLADEISSHFGGEAYPKWRARNIARTELGNAMNAGHQFGIEQLQEETGMGMGKEWVSVMGPTTRITHADADGQQTETPDGLFDLAGYQVPYPAHESLPPEERCNCQCTIISAFVMSAVDEGDGQPDIIGLDEDTEAELPEADPYQIPDATQDDIPIEEPGDPKIAAALDRLEAMEEDMLRGGFMPPFKGVDELPYGETEVNAWRKKMLADGKDPLTDTPTQKVKLSALQVDKAERISKADVSAMIQSPELFQPGGPNRAGLPSDLPVVVQKGGKLYIEDGHEHLTALKLQKKTKAEVYLVDLDAGKAVSVAGGGIPDFATLTDTGKTLGGSTGARLMQDPDGRLFVVKTGSSPAHLREEFKAEQAYRAAGVAVPNSRLEEVGDKPHKISEFIEGKLLSDLDSETQKKVFKQLQKGFGTDALLANWDTLGATLDNVIVAKDGTAYRIDVGGALRFRAQGAGKGAAFGNHPLELWSLKDPAKNKSGAKAFGDMTNKEMVESAKQTLQNREHILAAVKESPDLTKVLEARLDNMDRFVKMSDEFRGDKWKDAAIDRLAYHDQHMEASGVFKNFKGKLTSPPGDPNLVVDENGKDWDGLRGPGSSTAEFSKYLDKAVRENSHGALRVYYGGQADSSWSRPAQAMKHFVITSRDIDSDKYIFKKGHSLEGAKVMFKAAADEAFLSVEQLRETYAANQAFFYRFCKNVDFPNNDRENGVLLLGRTETPRTVERYKMKVGEFMKYPRGAAESFSLNTTVGVTGQNVTHQAVPHTRILAHYYHERYPGTGGELLAADQENEVVADAEGVKIFYKKENAKDGEIFKFEEVKAELEKDKKKKKKAFGTKYPGQPRDEQGQFASDGGGSSGAEHPVSNAVAAVEEIYPPANPSGTDTSSRHFADGKFTPEREELHKNILTELAHHAEVSQDKTYVMMGGGPASGKSSLIRSGEVELPSSRVHIDSDAIKDRLPEYKAMIKDGDLRAAGYVHSESSYLAKTALQDGLDNGYNVTLDGTGNASVESVQKNCDAARAAGFKVNAEYATCSTEEAVRRNLERAAKTGRLPPEDMLRNTHASVSRILPQAIERGLFDKVRLWDTEKLTDGKPTLVVSAEGSNLTVHNQDLWDSFRAKGN